MKDLLEILKQASGLPTPTMVWFAVCAALYFAYFAWKNPLSETTVLERQKRKLEIIKLALEIEAMRKQCPPATSSPANEPLENVFGTIPESKSGNVLAAFKSFTKHPLKWLFKVLTQRPKWLRYFVTGGLSASVYPFGIGCYSLLNLPPNTSADSLHLFVAILLVYLAVSVILGAIVSAIFNLGEIGFSLISGLAIGAVSFHLCAALFGLFLHLRLVFLNAH